MPIGWVCATSETNTEYFRVGKVIIPDVQNSDRPTGDPSNTMVRDSLGASESPFQCFQRSDYIHNVNTSSQQINPPTEQFVSPGVHPEPTLKQWI